MSDWVPTREAWDKFLSSLDADQDVAGQKYEDIRKRLIIYFECRKCPPAEDMADEVITRVIKRIYEGVCVENILRYAYGVARIVWLEWLEAMRREGAVRDALLRAGNVFEEPEEAGESDLRAKCFEGCLEGLSPEEHHFILSYYEGERRAKIDQRKSLAEKLNISKNAATLRAYHIRKRLEKCTNTCLKRSSGH